MLATNSFSKQDLAHAILTKTGLIVFVEKYEKMKNGAWLVVYRELMTKKRFSRFVSEKDLLKAKFERLVTRSKDVVFINGWTTDTGYHPTHKACDCPNFSDEKQRLLIDNKPVCKHTIAYAKRFLGCQKLSDFIRKAA